MFSHYIYFAVEDKNSANPFVRHVVSDEWNQYHYIKESGSPNLPKEKDMEKECKGSTEDTVIKSTLDKAYNITPGIYSKKHVHQPIVKNDDANTT